MVTMMIMMMMTTKEIYNCLVGSENHQKRSKVIANYSGQLIVVPPWAELEPRGRVARPAAGQGQTWVGGRSGPGGNGKVEKGAWK